MHTKISSLLFLCFLFQPCFAQIDEGVRSSTQLKVTGFVDIFYAYDFNRPSTNYRQPFLYNHNRHNEFNLNLGLLKLSIENSKYRANLALHTGTYVNDNYASEPPVLRHIYEASAGFALNKKNSLWLDAGIFSSHIGFESAVSMDNYTLTRSLSAENSPYFLTGAKLTYKPAKNWEICVLALNGWQKIQRVQGNSLLSSGTQVKYTPSEKVLLNWSTFIGTDDPDSTRRMRYFNNLYGQFTLTEKLSLIAGFDVGLQQKNKGTEKFNTWLSPTFIVRYLIAEKWATSLRAEHYQDEYGVIVPTGTPNGFTITGISGNVDYIPFTNFACRLEGRWLNSKDKLFVKNDNSVTNNFTIVASLAVKFE